MKIRRNGNSKFVGVWVPAEVWDDLDLGWAAKLLLLEIGTYGECRQTDDYFAKWLSLPKTKVVKMIKMLVKEGVLVIEQNGVRVLSVAEPRTGARVSRTRTGAHGFSTTPSLIPPSGVKGVVLGGVHVVNDSKNTNSNQLLMTDQSAECIDLVFNTINECSQVPLTCTPEHLEILSALYCGVYWWWERLPDKGDLKYHLPNAAMTIRYFCEFIKVTYPDFNITPPMCAFGGRAWLRFVGWLEADVGICTKTGETR